MTLFEKMVETISRYSMFGPGARVGIAVSGGADSVCLTHLVADLAPQWNLKLAAVHLNHGLRSAESDADEEFVRTLAERLGLPCFVRREELKQAEGNLEQAARLARLAFFDDLLKSDFDRIATAHSQSDQAETVLYRILRGSYTTGLAGIRPVTSTGLVRPLLYAPRSEIEDYLRNRSLPWREDSSNQDLSFDRNRIRHRLLPELAHEWNPQLPDILARHADLAREDDEFWECEVGRLAPGLLTTTKSGALIIHVRAVWPLPPAVRRRIIRSAIALIRGDLRQIDFRHIDAVLRICSPEADGHSRIQIPGVDVMRSFDWVRFAAPRATSRPEFTIAASIPGAVTLPAGAGIVSLEVVETEAGNLEPRDKLKVEGLDAHLVSALGESLRVRNWLPGDRFRRAGHSHQQKLKELFHDFRVPLWERGGWPVLTAGDRILWAKDFGVAAEFASTPSSGSIIQVSYRKVESAPACPASL
jgi:tRNA(Ile)-lysidine synthase